jgi:soluble lytic murein transglycosylase
MVSVPIARQTARKTQATGARTSGVVDISGGLNRVIGAVDENNQRIAKVKAQQADLEFDGELFEMLHGEDGYLSQRGQNAAEGINDFADRARALYDQKMSGLDGYTKQAAGPAFNARLRSALHGASRHATEQRGAWEKGLYEARVSQAVNGAVAARTPEEMQTNLLSGKIAIQNRGAEMGRSREEIEQDVLAFTSDVHASTALRMSADDPRASLAYVEENRDAMLPQVADQVVLKLSGEAARRNGMDVAQGAWMEAHSAGPVNAALQSGDYQAAAASILGGLVKVESGGNPNAVSPVGAIGLTQVMPATARAPGYGIADVFSLAESMGVSFADRSDASVEALLKNPEIALQYGENYLAAMLHEYDGNLPMALAAYNAGPGKVDEWIESIGDPRDGAISASEWVDQIPYDETRNYVPSVMAKARGGAADPMAVAASITDPDARAAAIARTRQLDAVAAGRRKREAEQAKQYAFAHVEEGGSVDDLPMEMRVGLGREYVSGLRTYEQKMAAGTPIETDLATYAMLSTMAADDPRAFGRVDIRKYAHLLSKTDAKKFADMIAKSGGGSDGTSYAGMQSSLKLARPEFYKFDKDHEQTQAAVAAYTRHVDRFVAKEGRNPNDREKLEFAREVSRDVVTSAGNVWDSKEPVAVVLQEAREALEAGGSYSVGTGEGRDVIDAVRFAQLTEIIAQRDGRTPTDDEVLLEWLRLTGDVQ